MKQLLSLVLVLMFLAGCGAKNPVTTASESNEMESILSSASEESAVDSATAESSPVEDFSSVDPATGMPVFIEQGAALENFIPSPWRVIDSVVLDYNQDGAEDFVAVLEESEYPMDMPRMLISAHGIDEGYQLDLQNSMVIRGADEGGIWGDPYMPMEVDNNCFIVNTFGGSAFKWAEDTKYQFLDGQWYVAQENTHCYDRDGSEYQYWLNDYEQGIGKRRTVTSIDQGLPRYGVEFTVPLDAAPLLEENAMRFFWAIDELYVPKSVAGIAPGINVDESIFLQEISAIQTVSDHLLLYIVTLEDQQYLALYNRETEDVQVLAQQELAGGEGGFGSPTIYQGAIYTLVFPAEDGNIMEFQIHKIAIEDYQTEVLYTYRGESPLYDFYYSVEVTGQQILLNFYDNTPHAYVRMDLQGEILEVLDPYEIELKSEWE